jgi:hypothetical protein
LYFSTIGDRIRIFDGWAIYLSKLKQQDFMTYENFDKVFELIAEEQDRLMKEEQMQPRPAWQSGLCKVASQLGVNADELRSKLKEHLEKIREEAEPIQWGTIKDERNQKDLALREYWHLQPTLFEAILKILFQHDPIGICNHDTGASQYSVEVNTILPRLEKASSVEDVHKIVYEEFVYWFNATGERSANKYGAIAKEIWELLHKEV